MTITIHQPEHLPWLGLLNKIAKAEIFVILDSVQFEKNYFQNRNRIFGTNGVQWVNVPVFVKGHMGNTIKDIKISGTGSNIKWRERYLRTIEMSYGKYPFYHDVYPVIETAIKLETDRLYDVNMSIIEGLLEKLDIKTKCIRSSGLGIEGFKSDLILSICKVVNADVYIAGPSGRDYLDGESFRDAGIQVKVNDYKHPIYSQKRSGEFISHLSCIDLFMNCGFEEGKKLMMDGNEKLSDF